MPGDGSHRPPARIAVCLSGQPRNYGQNVKFLRSFLDGSAVDVFFHLWECAEPDHILAALAPLDHVFDTQVRFAASDEAADMSAAVHREAMLSRPSRDQDSQSMYYSMWRANELKRRHERANDFRYDIVVRLRFDFFTLDRLCDVISRRDEQDADADETLYFPDQAHSVGLNDQFALGSSRAMDVYAAAFQELRAFIARDYFNPEYFLLQHVLAHGLAIRTIPLQYVILRDLTVRTFDVPAIVQATVSTWWSAPLPPVAPSALRSYFQAKSMSVRLIAELELVLPRVFRLSAPGRGFLRLDVKERGLGFTHNLGEASLFFLVVAGDEDRTAINIRCRDLRLANEQTDWAGNWGWNLAPDECGHVRPDAAADERSAFFLSGRPGALSFEWRPGHWQGVGHGKPAAGADDPTAERLFLAVGDEGLILQPGQSQAEVFSVEYVHDAGAEVADVGWAGWQALDTAASDTLLLKLSGTLHEAVRVYEQHGFREAVIRSVAILRRYRGAAAGTTSGSVARADRLLASMQRRL